MFSISSWEEYLNAYRESTEHPEGFWEEVAQHFSWRQPWKEILTGDFSTAKVEWFKGAKLNITDNALDRHVQEHPDRMALVWEPNDPKDPVRSFTYSELKQEVMKVAQMLRKLGVSKGDRVCLYMGMVPELAIAVLACARIGAIHSVIFGGFSAKSIVDRLQDMEAAYIITMDGAKRGNKVIDLKATVDEALSNGYPIRKVLTLSYLEKHSVRKTYDQDWESLYQEVVAENQFVQRGETMDAEDPLFILYTSGSTGKPKGVVHSTGGYMVWTAFTFKNVFQYNPGDLHFCTADIGWVTGHSYLIYGPLLCGATTLMFEGIPTFPTPARFWEIIDKHQVNIFYTAPTAIRSLMSENEKWVTQSNLGSLKVLGSVGEPINQEAWQWYHEKVGKGRCPIVDTFWQTETGGIMISSLAGVTPQKPVFATLPLPGVLPILLDEKGSIITENDVTGNLCFAQPWPSMIRTTWGDHERCLLNYFTTYPGYYFTGDGAYRDQNGAYRLTGRVDDVLNVSGHRIGTAEMENAINHAAGVIESAVVGYPHDIKGQGIFAFVICDQMQHLDVIEEKKKIIQTVVDQIGPIAKPDRLVVVSGLPKTRSGKIMRRILRKIAEGEFDAIGDTTTLLDPQVVTSIIELVKKES